ncbi:type II secretion system protein [bacterium]|nr:type II secretion system protein [bacterium]
MNKKKAFTLMELMVVIAISGWVLATLMLTYQTITKQTAKKRAQAETEEYLNMLNLGFQRTFGSMTSVQLISGNSSLLSIATPGYYQGTMISSHSFSQGAAQLTPPYVSNIYTSPRFGEVLILFVFKFDNPLLNKATSSTDMYRVMGISFTNNGELTKESNFVYLDQDYTTGIILTEKELAAKPKKLWLRKIDISPDTSNNFINVKLLAISIGVRDYLDKAKFREDQMSHQDPYNYETTKFYTLLIRSQ